jgi:hypothetical protein
VSIGELTELNDNKHKEISKEIEDLLELEELYWAQRSRINWLQYSDKNTAYFHNSVNARKQKNKIKKLQNPDGASVEGPTYPNLMISNYFSGLFSTEVYDMDPELLDKINPRVTVEMNDKLRKPFDAAEVKKKVLFSIGDIKAPGSDCLHAIFFKKCWHVLGEILTKEVLDAIDNKVIPEGWNDTIIVLIPKIDDPVLISQYRPISLCNVIYKVISKMIAFHFKHACSR